MAGASLGHDVSGDGVDGIRRRSMAGFNGNPRAPMPELILGNSGAAGEWRLCEGSCRTLSEIFAHPIGANVTTMRV
jgi:hypothetical protein